MNQGMENGRVCSGSPDSYEQFHVHRCDVECFVTSLFYTFVYFCCTIASISYVCESFNYRMYPWLRSMAAAEKRWLVNLGYKITSNQHVGKIVNAGMAGCSSYITMGESLISQLGPILTVIASYNTREGWGVLFSIVTIYLGYVFCRVTLTSIHYYFQERNMLYFCTNMVPVKEVNTKSFTKKMLKELYNLPEYRRLKQQRMTSGAEAWNWQTRQRMGETMPSDELSSEEEM